MKTLKVGAKTYTILHDELIRNDDNNGECHPDNGIIKIDPNLPNDSQEITLLHEIIHACLHFIGMGEKDKYTEEEICTKLAPILHTVLRENKVFNK